MNIVNFMEKFKDDKSIIEYYINEILSNDIICPACHSHCKKYQRKNKPKMFVCSHCKKEFSIFKGTIFEKSNTELKIWFYAIYRILVSKKGISALQICRETDVTYKTSWRMLHQIRIAMGNSKISLQFNWIVEIDETYIGGKPRMRGFKRGRGTNKIPVVGIIERKTKKVYAKVAIPNEEGKCLTGKQLLNIIEKVCVTNTIVITDDFRPYNILDKQRKDKYTHLSVNHSAKQYSDGNGTHTNTIESFWAIVKRGFNGIYHHFSARYTQNYIDEFCFRYNYRNINEGFVKILEHI